MRQDTACLFNGELSENCCQLGFLTETDPGMIVVYLDAKKLGCWVKVNDLEFFQRICLNVNRSCGGGLHKSHGHIMDIQKHHKPVAAEIQVGVG